MEPITFERVRELFHYDPETGVFTRRIATGRHGCFRAGSLVGGIGLNGYASASIDGKRFYLHRVAVLYMTGSWPAHDVDHIDTVRSNNKWSNLRCVERRVNCQNRIKSRCDRKHGTLMGVKKHRRRWQARINHKFIGSFKTEQEAHQAYVLAKRNLHEGCTL